MYFDIKELSRYLSIKPSTLYAWASQRKIPSIKIHGLIRFQKEAIDAWISSLDHRPDPIDLHIVKNGSSRDLDRIIARAKREVYNPLQGETRPIFKPQKGGK